VSDLRSGPLRHALKQAAATGATGSLLLGTAVVGIGAAGAGSATATSATLTRPASTTAQAAPVTIHSEQVASKRKHVDVPRMMRTAASLKGRPYRWGAAGPRAFDCSGYTLYVLKKQGIKIPRTAAQQYRKTTHIAKKRVRVGDLVFFYGRGGIYHVGIYAGKGRIWHSPHTGSVVKLAKIYSSHWKVGRLA
jgi:cell wall-associated NlpC family hydrolase